MITVNKIMSKDLCSVDVGTTVRTAAEVMRRERIGSLLIKKMDEPIGIVTERDLVWKVLGEQLDPDTTTVGMVMSAPLVTIEVGESLLEANDRMDRTAIRHLAVTEGGKVVGIISARDLLRYLEEIGW